MSRFNNPSTGAIYSHPSLTSVAVPRAKGEIFHHYQDVYRVLGRKAARALNDGDSGVCWALFCPSVTLEQVTQWCEAQGWVNHRVCCDYDCSGQIGQHVSIRSAGIGHLVTLSWSRDI